MKWNQLIRNRTAYQLKPRISRKGDRMYTPKTSSHFTPYQDPVTGVVTYILKNELAPLTQSFYFVNPSMTEDGRFLWFYCAFPPSGSAGNGRTLGLIDFETDEIVHFPETQFTSSSPAVDPKTGDLYWCNSKGVYKHAPKKGASVVFVASNPFLKASNGRMATHLTFSADRTELFLDGDMGDRWHMGSLRLADGIYTEWYSRDYCMDHAQFHPTDKDLVLFAEDLWTDKITGEHHTVRTRKSDGRYLRLWTIRRGEEPVSYPVYENHLATHEWWSRQGEKFYYCGGYKHNTGICSYNMNTGETVMEVLSPAWHGHSCRDDSLFTLDENDEFWRGCPSRTAFYNKRTEKKIYIISDNPSLFTKEQPSDYHTDPHPQFTADDRYIAHTTTVLGAVQFALTPVDQLIRMTQ